MRVPCKKLRTTWYTVHDHRKCMKRMDIIYLVHLVVFPGGKGEKVVRGEHASQTVVVCN